VHVDERKIIAIIMFIGNFQASDIVICLERNRRIIF